MTKKHYTQAAIDEQVPASDPVLNLVAQTVPPESITGAEVQEIIDRMFRVAHGRQGDAKYPTLVGLAAPQIGISKRIVIIGINAVGGGEQPELVALINPEIVEQSEKTEFWREGCFSTDRVCGIVERSVRVVVRAYDRHGKPAMWTFEGFPAKVAQHEIDHLNGIRFPDRITDDAKLHWVEEAEFGDYRKAWRDWKVRCARSKWEAIKVGVARN